LRDERASTGIPGLDEVLLGGFVRNQTYLITGPAGTGKTTFGWHYLTAGVAAGEAALYVTFSESEDRLRANARKSGFAVDGVAFLDLSPSSQFFSQAESYDIFSPDEVERQPTTQHLVDAVEKVKPRRVFIDSMTHLRYLSADAFQFRKQVLSFLRFLTDRGSDVVFVSESASDAVDDDLRFLSDGVIELSLDLYGRSLIVKKYRGSDFRGMRHSMRLSDKGIEVFPRLLPETHGKPFTPDALSFGIDELDSLLHGGLERGTTTILSGPSGVGKTTLGLQFMREAASRGERSVVFSFEERVETLVQRCRNIGIPVDAMLERGTLRIVLVEALRFAPDEFANLVRREVEGQGARIVMIDSVRGYQLSVKGEDLISHLHALCKYLQNMGVTTLLVNELESINEFTVSELGISYLADNVVFLRYLERTFGDRVELRKSIGVLKKRLSDFEKDLREFSITGDGVQITNTLANVRGILSQMPQVYESR
jgi:circadian clock protein KaiC